MRIALLTCILAMFCTHLDAQRSPVRSTLTLNTLHAMENRAADAVIPVLIEGDAQQIIAFLRENGQHYKFTAGEIVSANMDIRSIRSLDATGYAKRIDAPQGTGQLLNDVMVKHNNVDSAFFGLWPLDQTYDGTGVVIGIIDDPFDIDHPDFQDADGNTRIKYLWDQNLADGIAPAPYTYGTECDSAMIADGTCASTDNDEQNYSHGSGVTGVAASSGMAANAYRGVAPNADLILVSLNFSENFYTNLTDAVAYIYARAAELGKPCVINTSLGVYAGSHDGEDLTAQTIDALIEEQAGRAFVAAAGNAGNFPFHLGYTVTPTEQFTWFKKLSYMNLVYFQLWADTAEFNDVQFRLTADDPLTWANMGSTPVWNVPIDFDFDAGLIDSVEYTIPGAGSVKVYAQLDGGKYLLEFLATPLVPAHYWRFSTSGSGYFDIWSMEATTGFSNFVTTGLPTAAVLPEITQYRLPNTDQSIVSSWQCLDNVITVGSYVNRDTMTNFYGEQPLLIDEVGELFFSSSHGPTRDGRIKPDICATGARVLSTASDILTSWLIDLEVADYISQDGQHYLYNGTSFASPVVAGIAALYFQKVPGATAAEVKEAILSQARRDTFTGDSLPNNLWGYGKADAFRTLTGPWGCAADDYTEPPTGLAVNMLMPTKVKLEWDVIPNAAGYQVWYKPTGLPAGKVKSLSNLRTISGLTPNTTYTAKVRAFCTGFGFSDYSETITFTTPPLKYGETITANTDNLLEIFPNPAQHTVHVQGCAAGARFFVSNMLGEVMINGTATDEQQITLDVTTWPTGLYQITVEENGILFTEPILIAR